MLGEGGEGIRDPEKIGIPAAAARLGVGRKKTAGEGDRAVGPSGQWHKGERERSGRPRRRRFGRARSCGLKGQWAVRCGKRERGTVLGFGLVLFEDFLFILFTDNKIKRNNK